MRVLTVAAVIASVAALMFSVAQLLESRYSVVAPSGDNSFAYVFDKLSGDAHFLDKDTRGVLNKEGETSQEIHPFPVADVERVKTFSFHDKAAKSLYFKVYNGSSTHTITKVIFYVSSKSDDGKSQPLLLSSGALYVEPYSLSRDIKIEHGPFDIAAPYEWKIHLVTGHK